MYSISSTIRSASSDPVDGFRHLRGQDAYVLDHWAAFVGISNRFGLKMLRYVCLVQRPRPRGFLSTHLVITAPVSAQARCF